VPWTLALAGVLGAAALTTGTDVSTGATLASSPTVRSTGPLQTAFLDPEAYSGSSAEVAFDRSRDAGATAVRLVLDWSSVGPDGARAPAGFNPTNPADPAYRWASFDRQVVLAASHRLKPIVSVIKAPAWAQGAGSGPSGTLRPDPLEFGRFARAAALRYSGRFEMLPAVRHWQAWNEPNLVSFLSPQRVDGKAISPDLYREMLNSFASAVKSVDPRNVVVAGGLAPFTPTNPEAGVGPLAFMRAMLCLSKRLTRTCGHRSRFDIWAHHPYTSGGPTRHAVNPDDVSLGDLPKVRSLLRAAHRAGRIVSRGPPDFWVTEFSWDTKPPDPRGVPASLHARWVAEGLYHMWQNKVTLVAWFLLQDEPLGTSFFQSGLYYRGSSFQTARPKPALRAFRFPFVGFPRRGGSYVWGRTPAGRRGPVVIEQSFRGGWRRLGVVQADRNGIFQRRFTSTPVGWVRARNLRTREYSRPFSLKHHPDQFFNPFGLPTVLEPRRKGRP
jgi:hypothetical protein